MNHPGRCHRVRFTVGLAAAAFAAAPAPAADANAHFRDRVRPVLEANCFACHSHAAKKAKGGLVLDSRDAVLKGGDSGPAVVPGKPGESLLLKTVRHDGDVHMPPSGKLAAEDVATLDEWVKQGAVWPGGDTPATAKARPRGVITDEDRRWWAFQPLKPVNPPVVGDVPHPIDRFVRARLAAEGLSPSPQADRRALVRRVTFDLTGLPPTPEEVEAFVADNATDAYEKLVDRLLASPRYGERMARLWMDLVRYAESDGFRADDYRPNAWRYRDYLVRSFNQDKPYDRFVAEQLAGDEVAPDDPDALTATGFLRLGIYEYNQRDVRAQWSDMLNDVTDVTGDVFLGLGMGCARCHDHKFDPILQKDYYRLQAFFTPMLPRDDVPLATPAELADDQRRLAAWEKKTAEIRRKIDAIEDPVRASARRSAVKKFPPDIQAILDDTTGTLPPLDKQLAALAYRQVDFEYARLDRKLKDEQKRALVELRRDLTKFEAERPTPLPTGMTVTDVGATAPPTVIPKKKDATPVEPGVLTLLDEKPAVVPTPARGDTTGRRTALAAWLNRADNPLSHRVIVNRVWGWHFGQGLVATTSDFGKLGEKPTHPELLDWLADRFVRDGRGLKSLHRLILTSETYRQSAVSSAPAVALQKDPENRLLWTMRTRRLDAEQVRDAILAVTGRLDLAVGGPATDPTGPRRAVYTRVQRNTRDALLDAFDLPEGFTSTPQRNVTTTPTQALLMVNGPQLRQHARTLAGRVLAASGDDAGRVDHLFQLLYGRRPVGDERDLALAFLARRKAAAPPPAPADAPAELAFGKLPNRDGRGVLVTLGGGMRLSVADSPKLPDGEFTFEGFALLKSMADDAAVRILGAYGDFDGGKSGWSFGVTGRRSAFKPQKLVLQIRGDDAAGKVTLDRVFSGLHIDLNKPYYVAVSVRPGRDGSDITFYSKDLSNDDEPLQTDKARTTVLKLSGGRGEFRVGASDPQGKCSWDGLIDDVRLSCAALPPPQLLLTTDGVGDRTAGYWQFEPSPGPLRDASPNKLDLRSAAKRSAPPAKGDPLAAWAELCHTLLNSNEFLYVD
jgi:mono/diheme cytochrome c family protein